MGTTTLLFEDGKTQILIDGFFSRPSLVRGAIGWVRPNPARIAEAIACAGIDDRLEAIFVAHSHIDHVLDAPELARKFGKARIVGSDSVRNFALGHKISKDRIDVAENDRSFKVGDFRVTTLEVAHSRPEFYSGGISTVRSTPLWAPRLRAGKNYSFFIVHGKQSFLVHPSAGYRPALMKGKTASVVFLGIAQLGKKDEHYANAYWAELVQLACAHTVVPIHWDNYGRSLARGLVPMPSPFDRWKKGRAHVTRLASAHQVRVVDLPIFVSTPLSDIVSQQPDGACHQPRAPALGVE